MKFRLPLLSIYLVFFFLLIGSLNDCHGQKTRQSKKSAEKFFELRDYKQSLFHYLNYSRQKELDEEDRIRVAICLYHTNQIDQAIERLEYLIQLEDQPTATVHEYLAKSYHAQNNFEDAILHYKNMMRLLDLDDDRIALIIDQIKRCGAGLIYQRGESLALVENMGEVINSSDDEFGPILSPTDPDRIYYSAVRVGNEGGKRNDEGISDPEGSYKADIFYSEKVKGVWTSPGRMPDLINGPKHNKVLDFYSGGKAMLYFKGYTMYSGEMLIDTFKTTERANLTQYSWTSPASGPNGDISIDLFQDSILIFSSRRPGGYGGLDLFVAHRNSKGSWSSPINLGPRINGPYDETSPFLASDGRTLFFSSNNTNGIGDHDIYWTRFDEADGSWSVPENLGIPLNSSEDDMDLSLSPDGYSGVMCSSRKSGMGDRDLYSVYFTQQMSLPEEEQATISFYHILGGKTENEERLVSEELDKEELVIPKPDFERSPLFYNDKGSAFSRNEKNKLSEIGRFLISNPDVNLVLSGHSDGSNPEKFDHYFTIQKVQEARSILLGMGIDPNRLYAVSKGDNYPWVKKSMARTDALNGFNRRIEWQFITSDFNLVPTNEVDHELADHLLDPKRRVHGFELSGLTYRVSIASSDKLLESSKMIDYPDAMIDLIQDSERFLYTVGMYKNFELAQQLVKNLEKEEVGDYTIIPYVNGARLTQEKAVSLVGRYPDLRHYLEIN